MTPQEALVIGKEAVEALVASKGWECAFPFDEIWQHTTHDVPSPSRPAIAGKLQRLGYIELTGNLAKSVTAARAGSPTREYRPGKHFHPSHSVGAVSTGIWPAETLAQALTDAGLVFQQGMPQRITAALLSKPFLILTGLSGSGKTKMAQAFARWITPDTASLDPFRPGASIEAATKAYTITKADSLGVECMSPEGTRVLLPRGIIQQWADYIEANNIPETMGAQELRDKIVQQGSDYSPYLQRFETHYKPAAFALVKARSRPVPTQYHETIPVGADWTSNAPIVGYPDALDSSRYVTTPALNLIRRAMEPSNAKVPHFLILDEMNLSHVERYFADILSAIESRETIPLHDGTLRKDGNGMPVPGELELPQNLFIIGTVNIDETTYMFSPKVLDRAHVIEFTVSREDIAEFLADPTTIDFRHLAAKGKVYGAVFVEQAARNDVNLLEIGQDNASEVQKVIDALFGALASVGAEFGYRPAYEITRFICFYAKVSGNAWKLDEALDAAIMQKLLPKLHGSKTKLGPVLIELKKILTKERFKISFAKIERMEHRLKQNGFTSYAEA